MPAIQGGSRAKWLETGLGALWRPFLIDIACTCWPYRPPPGEEQEIIEIGICCLNPAACEPLEKRSLLVKPERLTSTEGTARPAAARGSGRGAWERL
jgi:hypothetical protein